MKKIITVEKTLNTGNKKGVMFLPMIPVSTFKDYILPEYIELRLPNGHYEKRKVIFTIPRLKPKELEVQYLIMLKSEREENFPKGTEIWGELTKSKTQIKTIK